MAKDRIDALTKAAARVAAGLPGAEEGIACAGTAIESRTYKVKGKAFVFVRPGNVMLKLGPSLAAAATMARSAVPPGSVKAGAGGWVTIARGANLPVPVITRWVKESHGLFTTASGKAGTKSGKRVARKAVRKAAKKVGTRPAKKAGTWDGCHQNADPEADLTRARARPASEERFSRQVRRLRDPARQEGVVERITFLDVEVAHMWMLGRDFCDPTSNASPGFGVSSIQRRQGRCRRPRRYPTGTHARQSAGNAIWPVLKSSHASLTGTPSRR